MAGKVKMQPDITPPPKKQYDIWIEKLVEIRKSIFLAEGSVIGCATRNTDQKLAITKAKELLQVFQKTLHDCACKEVVEFRDFKLFQATQNAIRKVREQIKTNQNLIARSKAVDKEMAKNLEKLKASEAFIEHEMRSYGKLVQFPVPTRKRKVLQSVV